MSHQKSFAVGRMVGALVLAALWAGAAGAQEGEVAFLGWSDQHVKTDGQARHLIPAIEAMNAIAGTSYPDSIGGKVEAPAFVFGCGDSTEWPTHAAKNAYEEMLSRRLKIKSYEMVGNHDEGGKSPSRTIKDWIIARHGGLSYSFEEGGVRFIAVYSAYDEELNNPAQAISKEALAYIRQELGKLPKGQPAVVALHLCFDAITNRQELVEAFGQANVILVLGGHYHKATAHEYKGYRFVQLPSPESTTLFTVVRIRAGRVQVIPYDYKKKAWSEDRRTWVDAEIKGERAAGEKR